MYTILIYSGGRRVDALLLSASPDRLRLAIPGHADTVEFRMLEGRWTSDCGEPVEIGALVVNDHIDAGRFQSQARVRTSSAF